MHSIHCFLNLRSDIFMDFNGETDFVFGCLLGAYIQSLRQSLYTIKISILYFDKH